MKKLFYLTQILREASGAPPNSILPKDMRSTTLAKDLFSGFTVSVQQSG